MANPHGKLKEPRLGPNGDITDAAVAYFSGLFGSEWLSPSTLAEACGVHVNTITALIRCGKLPAVNKAGRGTIQPRWSIPPSVGAMSEWCAAQKTEELEAWIARIIEEQTSGLERRATDNQASLEAKVDQLSDELRRLRGLIEESLARKAAVEVDSYSVKQLAEKEQISPSTVYDMIQSGRLPAARIGKGRGTIRIDRADWERYKKHCMGFWNR
jgi:excisionase family DNA binding protein